jgi:16S rRNA U516 pseudouridylate synthase RsuA-like enzyme
MLAHVGHKVRDLTRVRMGPLTLHGLEPGDFRALTPREVKALKSLGQEPAPAQRRTDEDHGRKKRRSAS